MRISVPRVKNSDIFDISLNENSSIVGRRVMKCHQIQSERFNGKNILYNSEASFKLANTWILKNDEILKLVNKTVDKYQLSGRAVLSLLKVARTIADMESMQNINQGHIIEALNYRINFSYV